MITRVSVPAAVLATLLEAGAAVAAPQGSAAAAEAAPVSTAQAVPEPRVERRVAEDDQVRVDELRVRGETRQITVQPKLPGARPYEIVPATGALDPSQRGRRPPGTSQWRVLNF